MEMWNLETQSNELGSVRLMDGLNLKSSHNVNDSRIPETSNTALH